MEASSSSLNRPVFFGSALLILALVLYSVLLPEHAQDQFAWLQSWIIDKASWFYVLTVALILICCVFLAVSRYGDLKLGPDHSQPEYRNTTWFAMLFSAGMGIGLMFFGQFDLIHGLNLSGRPLASVALTLLPGGFWDGLTGVPDAAGNAHIQSFLQLCVALAQVALLLGAGFFRLWYRT